MPLETDHGEGVKVVLVHRPERGFIRDDEGGDLSVPVGEIQPRDVILDKPTDVRYVLLRDAAGNPSGWK